ncbi:Diaminopimelate epimerase [uncultured Gammaproteobacteria bacterium]
MTTPFLKMHGLGNDFVVFDARRQPLALSDSTIRALSDRHTGVGCDQLIVIAPPRSADSDAFMLIFNADGSEVGACGNATRCVGARLLEESGRAAVVIETRAGLLRASAESSGLVAVDMGPARVDWAEIPLAGPADTLHLDLTCGELSDPVAVSMGNPHVVFLVEDAESVALDRLGSQIEHHALFPERTNVEVVQVLAPDRLRMRVWERGAGITQACGTGACAALVAAARRGVAGRRAEVVLDGGVLAIAWREDGHVIMTGPAVRAFSGQLTLTDFG